MRRFLGSNRPNWHDRARIRRAADVSVLYAFSCPSCNQTLEEFFAIGQAPDTIPCDCGAPAKRTIARLTFSKVPGAHDATYSK